MVLKNENFFFSKIFLSVNAIYSYPKIIVLNLLLVCSFKIKLHLRNLDGIRSNKEKKLFLAQNFYQNQQHNRKQKNWTGSFENCPPKLCKQNLRKARQNYVQRIVWNAREIWKKKATIWHYSSVYLCNPAA